MVSSRAHARSRRAWFAWLPLLLLASTVGFASSARAADEVSLTTPYPAVAAAPGAKVSFAISVTTATPGRVDLEVRNVPSGWEAALRGGGFIVDGVQSDGSEAVEVTLDVTVADAATAGTQRLAVVARKDGATTTLPVDIRITPTAAGSVSLTTDYPQLKGSSNQTYSFSLLLTNQTPDDLTFGVVANGPAGWTVTATLSQAQAATILVKAGSSTTVTVTAKPADGAAADTYPITVDATSGDQKAQADLEVEITGSYAMTLTTPDGRLNATASAGGTTDLSLVVTNSGTADIEGVTLSATTPTGWTAKFDPPTVTVPSKQSVQVTAHLTPSTDAIAGDYVATFRAVAQQANASTDIRVTIETSLVWGVIGIGIVAIVLVGLLLAFRRFGRR